ncbi:hypothetical protein FRC17_010150, partial [Serendipita sp. 399]
MTWSTTTTDNLILHSFTLAAQSQFQATDNRAEYGLGYHAMLPGEGITYQAGQDRSMRRGFDITGFLNNTVDRTFREINDKWPCFALARDLGNITSAAGPVVFAVGLSRDPAVSYATADGQQSRSLFYRTQFAQDSEA